MALPGRWPFRPRRRGLPGPLIAWCALLVACSPGAPAVPSAAGSTASVPTDSKTPTVGSPAVRPVASPGVAPSPALRTAPAPTPRPTVTSTRPPSPGPVPSTTPPPARWRLVALGDSIPYGGRYCDGCVSFVVLYARMLGQATGHPVSLINDGVPGLTTAQLLLRIRTRDGLRAAIAAADVITLTIGHNDTPWNSLHDACDGSRAFFGAHRDARWDLYTGACLAAEVERYRQDVAAILDEVLVLRAGRPTLIRVTTDYDQVIGAPAAPSLAPTASRRVLEARNQAACEVAIGHGGGCVDVHHAFNGPDGDRDAARLLAGDHDHPSEAGHRLIADLLAASGRGPLAP